MRPAEHQPQQRGEEFGRPVMIGLRQGRAPRQHSSQVVEPRPLAFNPADNLAQARRTRQLSVEQRQKLALRRQSAHPRIGPMRAHQRVEFRPRQMLQQLMKHAIVMPHGADPRFVSGTFGDVQPRIDTAPCKPRSTKCAGQPWAWPGHLRLGIDAAKAWITGTSPVTTIYVMSDTPSVVEQDERAE
jgi:hypothetical protein